MIIKYAVPLKSIQFEGGVGTLDMLTVEGGLVYNTLNVEIKSLTVDWLGDEKKWLKYWPESIKELKISDIQPETKAALEAIGVAVEVSRAVQDVAELHVLMDTGRGARLVCCHADLLHTYAESNREQIKFRWSMEYTADFSTVPHGVNAVFFELDSSNVECDLTSLPSTVRNITISGEVDGGVINFPAGVRVINMLEGVEPQVIIGPPLVECLKYESDLTRSQIGDVVPRKLIVEALDEDWLDDWPDEIQTVVVNRISREFKSALENIGVDVKVIKHRRV